MKYTEYLNLIRNAIEAENENMFIAEYGYPADCPYSPDELLKVLHIIYSTANGSVEDIINKSGVNLSEFARKFQISRRSLEGWKYKQRNPPDYVKMFLGFVLVSEIPTQK